MPWLKLRAPEWMLVGYFAYLCILAPFFAARPRLQSCPLPLLLLIVFAVCCLLARLEQTRWALVISHLRDFLPVFLTLLAFQTMECFLPTSYDQAHQQVWIQWDRIVLGQWRLQPLIESAGPLLPDLLELCYLLVYGLPFYCLGILYAQLRRKSVDAFLCVYLTGTLTAYGLFPFFPTEPPRLAFPNVAVPVFTGLIRRTNLAILQSATIHVGVFPSAHVSSAFAAAFGLLVVLPERKAYGLVALAYAVCVSLAVVYGRYHYVVDVLSGFGVSLVAALLAVAIYQFSRSRKLRICAR